VLEQVGSLQIFRWEWKCLIDIVWLYQKAGLSIFRDKWKRRRVSAALLLGNSTQSCVGRGRDRWAPLVP